MKVNAARSWAPIAIFCVVACVIAGAVYGYLKVNDKVDDGKYQGAVYHNIPDGEEYARLEARSKGR
ncbi:MAG TPA: hypothetical protein V6C69_18545 [Trichormus sp.]|jgi:hypothetical protein